MADRKYRWSRVCMCGATDGGMWAGGGGKLGWGGGGGGGAIKTYFNQFLIYYLLKRKRHDTRKDLYNDLYYTSTTGIF